MCPFSWPLPGLLTSATNPESGTVSYIYNSDKTLQSKTDAKGQKTEFTYDAYHRVTQTRRYTPSGGGGTTEDTCQREDYAYDTNPYDAGFTANAKGQLAAVQYKGGDSLPFVNKEVEPSGALPLRPQDLTH